MSLRWTKSPTTGAWIVKGPADEMKLGTVIVSRRDGSTSEVELVELSKPRMEGVGVLIVYGKPAEKRQPEAPVAPPVAEAPVQNAAAVATPKLESPRIFNGTHTLRRTDRDEYYVFRIRTAGERSKLAGKRIVAFQNGPDNENDFEGFAFLDGTEIRAWRRYQGGATEAMAKLLIATLLNENTDPAWEVLSAGTCICCNRKLTTPESIQTGIGPVCGDRGHSANDRKTARMLRKARKLERELAALETSES